MTVDFLTDFVFSGSVNPLPNRGLEESSNDDQHQPSMQNIHPGSPVAGPSQNGKVFFKLFLLHFPLTYQHFSYFFFYFSDRL